jgi:hypothetical protein
VNVACADHITDLIFGSLTDCALENGCPEYFLGSVVVQLRYVIRGCDIMAQ